MTGLSVEQKWTKLTRCYLDKNLLDQSFSPYGGVLVELSWSTGDGESMAKPEVLTELTNKPRFPSRTPTCRSARCARCATLATWDPIYLIETHCIHKVQVVSLFTVILSRIEWLEKIFRICGKRAKKKGVF